MRRMSTGTVPAPDKPGGTYDVIVVDPQPELSVHTFVAELQASAIGANQCLVSATVKDERYVHIVLVSFAIARWGLMQTGELKKFLQLLPQY